MSETPISGCLVPDFQLTPETKSEIISTLRKQGVDSHESCKQFVKALESALSLYKATMGDDYRQKEVPTQLFALREHLSPAVKILQDPDIRDETKNILLSKDTTGNIRRTLLNLETLLSALESSNIPRPKKPNKTPDIPSRIFCQMLFQAYLKTGCKQPFTYTQSTDSSVITGGIFDIITTLRNSRIIEHGTLNGILKEVILESKKADNKL